MEVTSTVIASSIPACIPYYITLANKGLLDNMLDRVVNTRVLPIDRRHFLSTLDDAEEIWLVFKDPTDLTEEEEDNLGYSG